MEHKAILQADEHFLPNYAIIGYSQDKDYYHQGHYFSYHNIVGEKLTAGMPLTNLLFIHLQMNSKAQMTDVHIFPFQFPSLVNRLHNCHTLIYKLILCSDIL